MESADVCIHGAGAVGLTLALALARQGLQVALPGELPQPAQGGDIRAYALNAASRALLTDLKVWQALPADAVTPVYDMHVAGDAAGAALHFSAWSQRVEALAWIVDAAELDTALRSAVRFAPHLHFAAGAVEAALTVHAEGKDSPARAALGVRFERHAYGQTALATRLESTAPHAGAARQWFRSPDVLALLPFDRPAAGRSYALVWSLAQDRAQELLQLADADFEAALNQATGGITGGMTGGISGTLRLAGPRAAWPLAIARADRLCGPGWVLVGDAAHLVHPLAGQGLNLGLGDVATLARVVAEREPWRGLGDVLLLGRYARERALPTRAMAALTDGLLHLFASEQPLARELRNRGLTLLNHLAPIKRALTARALDA